MSPSRTSRALSAIFALCIISCAQADLRFRDHEDVDGHHQGLLFGHMEQVEDKHYWHKACQEDLRSQLAKSPIVKKAKNIVFFLGDGTSISTLTAARLYKGGLTGQYEHQVMEWEKFPYSTLIKTYSNDKQVTDSAASATAYLTGTKGNQRTLGVDGRVKKGDCAAMNVPEYHSKSVLSNFQDADRSTGVVTVTRVTHASPAGNYAHTANRNWENDDDINDDFGDTNLCDDVAEQLVFGETGSKIKVILGGGRQKFLPKGVPDPEGNIGGRRDDGKNLIDTWLHHKKDLGNASYVWHREQLLALDANETDYLMGLFDYSHMAFAIDNESSNPTLAEMTRKAIEVLRKDDNGFFLFVEGGNIDRAHHLNQAKSALTEALHFEAAIQVATEMTSAEDTLIVVTADHSHPLVINGYPDRGQSVVGLGDFSDVDVLPYTTLLYTNGPGYRGTDEHGVRPDPAFEDLGNPHYANDATIPMVEANHAGEEVVLYARGPHAHLFTGIHENAYIPHALRYAACVGDGLHFCKKDDHQRTTTGEMELL
ncbi:alkaline phosphatase-like [Oratosquilla oratoria]|uniref:alkaline phosphatase-like n=1 Tax=Oratosquilla oratoria TaxID=337810 RepID=UPI003F761BC5